MPCAGLLVFSFTALCTASSCEKVISFKPRDAQPLVVVEATIENGQPPVVILSNSVNFFATISPDILSASFIHDAVVEVSNGSRTHRLKEYRIADSAGYDLYYYSIDSANLASAFLGQLSTSYTLNITVNGNTYRSQTSIPALEKRVDSVWWEPAPPTVSDRNFVKLMARITDPAGFGNYVRYFTRVNRKPFLPGLNSVFDDQIIDGTTYTVQVDPGINRNDEIDFQTDNWFIKGDTVTLKFCNIDKATFDFWRTLEYSYASIGNPFASPTRVLSNIGGGALGYFGGYAVQYSTLIIPR